MPAFFSKYDVDPLLEKEAVTVTNPGFQKQKKLQGAGIWSKVLAQQRE